MEAQTIVGAIAVVWSVCVMSDFGKECTKLSRFENNGREVNFNFSFK